ncbi:hypothetical protein LUZ60_016801 [Juncus effusus]|nr:hypothetical protein LUZ60_016801 [Juncus effusus]
MASKATLTITLFLTINLLFFTLTSACGCGCGYCPPPTPNPTPKPPRPPTPTPPTPTPPTPNPTPPTPNPSPPATGTSCPIDTLKLGVCANLLGGLINLELGKPPKKPCCSLLSGLADLEAAVCLCTAIKANILGINLNIPIDLSLLVNYCGKKVVDTYLFACVINMLLVCMKLSCLFSFSGLGSEL